APFGEDRVDDDPGTCVAQPGPNLICSTAQDHNHLVERAGSLGLGHYPVEQNCAPKRQELLRLAHTARGAGSEYESRDKLFHACTLRVFCATYRSGSRSKRSLQPPPQNIKVFPSYADVYLAPVTWTVIPHTGSTTAASGITSAAGTAARAASMALVLRTA